jgi:single-strand DNA-binding protein
MNTLMATGRLAADAEVRTTTTGTAVCQFKLANDVGYGNNKKTNWLKCTIWGKRAESGLVQYLVKGQQVTIVGELSTDEWTDKDGNKRTDMAVRVADLELGGKSGGQSGGYSAPVDDGSPVPF